MPDCKAAREGAQGWRKKPFCPLLYKLFIAFVNFPSSFFFSLAPFLPSCFNESEQGLFLPCKGNYISNYTNN